MGLEEKLFEIQAVKFGEFTLKSGMKSPVYIDLRILVSYPGVLRDVAKKIAGILKSLDFDRIAAVPYAAIPIATAVSLEMARPMVYTRKEAKDYGTKKTIEGEFLPGETVVLLDDLITTAKSKFEAIETLKNAGLNVRDVVVLIDREQGGKEELEKAGLKLHAAIKLTDMLDVLEKAGKVSAEQKTKAVEFIRQNRA